MEKKLSKNDEGLDKGFLEMILPLGCFGADESGTETVRVNRFTASGVNHGSIFEVIVSREEES